MNLDIASATTPLFFIGFDELSEELTNLRSRTNGELLIPGLRDLQEKLTLLHSIKIEEKGIHSVTVDQVAYPQKTASSLTANWLSCSGQWSVCFWEFP